MHTEGWESHLATVGSCFLRSERSSVSHNPFPSLGVTKQASSHSGLCNCKTVSWRDIYWGNKVKSLHGNAWDHFYNLNPFLQLLTSVLQNKIWVWAGFCPIWSLTGLGAFSSCQGHLGHPGAIFTSTRNIESRLPLPPVKEELVVPLGGWLKAAISVPWCPRVPK